MVRLGVIVWLAVSALAASEHRGQVTFNSLPVPGATVTAVQEGKRFVAITDQMGLYSFPDLTDGVCGIAVEMFGFAAVKQDVSVAPHAPEVRWDLKLLSLDQIHADQVTQVSQPAPPHTPAPPAQARGEVDDVSERAADGFLINGSMNNGAASPFAQGAAFGNNRFGGRGLYTGGIGMILDNSALDARPFSLTGQDTSKAAYNRLTGVVTFGGPLRIPRLLKNGPNFFVGYQWTRNNNATIVPALVPNLPQRESSHISPQSQALLNLYPLPNFAGSSRYNYQTQIVSPTHQDALQSRFNKTLGSKNQVYGRFAFQSTRTDNPNLFGFLDTSDSLGINASANWSHRLGQQSYMNLGYQFSRLATHVTPFFENRLNISGQAGISGNNQDPMNWGPPRLTFSSGIAGLSDSQSSFDRNQTSGLSFGILWNRRAHNVSWGGDFRRQEFNYLSQQDPRGSFMFTGVASGSDFTDFLLGIPDTVSVAFGNADKYFRQSVYDAYVADDWRVGPALTVNAGLRWEYGSPTTELYDRLVNLDIASGFGAVAPVVANRPTGALSGQRYPSSLVRPDKRGIQPRVGIAWRPLSGSSLVIRAGYGVYYDTSVYQNIALEMAQQPPLSKTLSLQNKTLPLLTLANAFTAPTTFNTFAIDPNFRVGYAQNWQLAVQRDLPGSLQMTVGYLGIKGTRGVQDFLPNTYPIGAANPCPTCPSGFSYVTSNGNSTRESAEIQLRRRLHNGIAATLQYTFSKSIDDDAWLAPGSTMQNPAAPAALTNPVNFAIAQNWLDLRGERGLSVFDQRHLISLQMQYTSGMGLGGGTLWSGWKGGLLKDWTFSTQITAGSGLPQTPIYLAPVEGTGVTGTIRPNYTGAPLYAAPSGLSLNPAAYTAPLAGQWGNAGRNSIIGPAEFTLDSSLGRTFRVSDRLNLDLRVDSTNALNHVTFTAWNTIVNGLQFGLPAAANAMRSMQTTLRLRF